MSAAEVATVVAAGELMVRARKPTWALCVALPLVGVVSLILANGAAADPVARASFSVGKSNGYHVSVSGYDDEVTIEVEGDSEQAEYIVQGRVTGQGVWANFGKRGEVAVEFRPSGSLNRRLPPARCEGKPRTTRFGSFVGQIRFRGERGYVEVDARRGWGGSHVERRWRCPRRRGRDYGRCRPDREEQRESVELKAGSDAHRASLSASADRFAEERGFTAFWVSTYERYGRVEVRRAAFPSGPDRSFLYTLDLTSATLSPPRPFSGSAVFQRRPDGTGSWTGDLRVSLPGASDLALAGPKFGATLKRPDPGSSVICFLDLLAQESAR